MKYPSVKPGEWVKPKRRFYYMACCDCGLVHKIEFSLVKRARRAFIFMRAWRDERRTALVRRRVKHRKD